MSAHPVRDLARRRSARVLRYLVGQGQDRSGARRLPGCPHPVDAGSAGTAAARPVRGGRDLRVDFFRGFSLLVLFGYHIPGNIIFWITPSAIGFSDPAEAFVFLAGYSAGIAQIGRFDRQGWAAAARHIWARCLELYRWHLLLGASFLVLVLWIATWAPAAAKPYHDFLHALRTQPLGAFAYIGLDLQPPLLNILPLFILLFALLPLALPLAARRPALLFALSLGIYALAREQLLRMPAPLGAQHWFFDPFAWQFVFFLGVLAGSRARRGVEVVPFHRVLIALAIAYLLFAFTIILFWYAPPLAMPDWLQAEFGRVRKWTESPLRLLHFLALTYVAAWLVPVDAAWLRSRAAQAVVRVGQHSLELFAAGVVLSLLGMAIFGRFGDGLPQQFAVDLVGIGLLLSLAQAFSRRARAARAASRT